jgi:hypothetical protein
MSGRSLLLPLKVNVQLTVSGGGGGLIEQVCGLGEIVFAGLA